MMDPRMLKQMGGAAGLQNMMKQFAGAGPMRLPLGRLPHLPHFMTHVFQVVCLGCQGWVEVAWVVWAGWTWVP
jgi:hypothetical protein